MKRFCVTLCAVFMFTTAYLQNSIPKAQTLFIYDFSELAEWPSNYRSGPFIIGILGHSDVINELKSYTLGKKIGNQDIQVRQFDNLDEITTCHILFVPFSKTRQMPYIKESITGTSTLLITEKNGALEYGSAINFVIVKEKMRFEVSVENASKYGISFNPQLKEMAILSM